MANERVEFEVLGQKYTIRSEASPEYVRKLVDYLEATLRDLDPRGGGQEPTKLSILAALHVTDELFRARERSAELPADAAKRIHAMVKLLDGVLS